jgi:peptidoglycan-associated lipoprotein
LIARFSTRVYEGGNKVNQKQLKWISLVFVLGVIMMAGACKKKVAPPPPPPPPAPAAPTASLTANPNSIEPGQSTTLTWETSGATDVTIDGIGAVQATGSQQVSPSTSTTYHLTAKGGGGTQEATARVTVAAAPAAPVASNPSEDELFSSSVKDIYFDYDKFDIPSGQQSALQADIAFLKEHSGIHITIEGHCDERGSTEYNLALGDNRAGTVKSALERGGIGGDRVRTISYGKERPFCTESNESCWQQNRRGHFVHEK